MADNNVNEPLCNSEKEYEIQLYDFDLQQIYDYLHQKVHDHIKNTIELTSKQMKEKSSEVYEEADISDSVECFTRIVLKHFNSQFKLFQNFLDEEMKIKPHILLPEDKCQLKQYTKEEVQETENHIADIELQIKQNRYMINYYKNEMEYFQKKLKPKIDQVDRLIEQRNTMESAIDQVKHFLKKVKNEDVTLSVLEKQ